MAKHTSETTSKLFDWLRKPFAGRLFASASLAILLLTTLFWTILSAGLQRLNSDQLVDSFLFENLKTFNGASFPGAHSFLLKWPIFGLMQLYGSGVDIFTMATVFIVLLTLGALVYVLHRIEKRPYVFGVYCLALSSVLLLVPAQPYAGALLPANMAMTTTRNIEYIALILVFWLMVTAPKLRSGRLYGAALLLAVVIASDKLFAALALGGAVLMLGWYGLVRQNREETKRALGWLGAVVAAYAAATVISLCLNSFGITGILSGGSTSPFAVVKSMKDLALGIIFGIAGLLTNFGANPVHDVTVLGDVPSRLWQSLHHLSAAAYAVNFALLLAGVYATVRMIIRARAEEPTPARNVALLLIGATIAAAAVFAATDHYYPVDSRYLTVGLFAVAISAAVYWRRRRLNIRVLGVAALLLMAVLPIGMAQSAHEYEAGRMALAPRSHLASRVAEEVDRHNISRLIGDYWDIMPAKAEAAKKVTPAPVNNCVTPQTALSSSNWFKAAQNAPEAFLAVRDDSPDAGPNARANLKQARAGTVTFGGCTIEKVVGAYGVPSERVAIDPTVIQKNNPTGLPNALLLLYPHGIKTLDQLNQERRESEPASVPHNELTSLSDTADCAAGTSMQVVAHQDDDLLFMNPDLMTAIKAGRCLRTVYLTAGNAGQGFEYWTGREKGAKAAYAKMFELPDTWHDERQYIGDHSVVVSTLEGMPKVALVFMRLPDGNLHGEGFEGNKDASLLKLLNGSLANIRAVDQSATYTKDQLIVALETIMNTDQPDVIRTLSSNDVSDGDHADHHAAGTLTDLAAAAYEPTHTVTHYLGYPDLNLPADVTDTDLDSKQTVFMAYAKFDGAVCQTIFECNQNTAYGGYLTRQYSGQADTLSTEPQSAGTAGQ